MNFQSVYVSGLLDKRLSYSTHIYNIFLNFGKYTKTSKNVIFLSDEAEYYKKLIKEIDAELSSLSNQKSV